MAVAEQRDSIATAKRDTRHLTLVNLVAVDLNFG